MKGKAWNISGSGDGCSSPSFCFFFKKESEINACIGRIVQYTMYKFKDLKCPAFLIFEFIHCILN